MSSSNYLELTESFVRVEDAIDDALGVVAKTRKRADRAQNDRAALLGARKALRDGLPKRLVQSIDAARQEAS